jgi:3-methyladenine DNA glycosylase Tag
VFLEVLSGAPIELIELSTDSAGFFWISISYKKEKWSRVFFRKNDTKPQYFFFDKNK